MVALLFVMIGQVSQSKQAVRQNEEISLRYQELEKERNDLLSELEQFRDENLRVSYWKWLTMSREPGEYYIDFHE